MVCGSCAAECPACKRQDACGRCMQHCASCRTKACRDCYRACEGCGRSFHCAVDACPLCGTTLCDSCRRGHSCSEVLLRGLPAPARAVAAAG